MKNRLITALGGLTCALVLSGCTLVPTTSAPTVHAPGSVPFGLTNSAMPGTANGHVTFTKISVYLYGHDGLLHPVSRLVPEPASFLVDLNTLVASGPYEASLPHSDLHSVLPASTEVLRASLIDGIALIDLSKSLSQAGTSTEVRELAQIIMTASASGANVGVELFVEDRQVYMPTVYGGKTLLATPYDYKTLVAT